MVSVEKLKRDLDIFSCICHVEGYAIIGGEPTLHPQIVELLEVARDSGICDRLEVWTNGIGLLNRFPEGHRFWTSFDQLVLSRYPGKLTNGEVYRINLACENVGIDFRLIDESVTPNWTRLLDAVPSNDSYAQEKYSVCWFKTYCRVLDNGHFGRCCTVPFIPKLLQSREFGSDMLKVDESLTEEMLTEYLAQETFMESCRVCAGRETPSAVKVEWREERDSSKWLEASRE